MQLCGIRAAPDNTEAISQLRADFSRAAHDRATL